MSTHPTPLHNAQSPRDFEPGTETGRAFRDALGHFATGITVVTCNSDIGPLGITANSFASVSLDPPLVLWSPAKASKRFAAFSQATHFAIHVMSDTQRDVCGGFATNGGAFDALSWRPSETGVPLIDGCLTRFECTRHALHDAGDHAIIVGRVTRAQISGGNPLMFYCGKYGGFEET